MKVFFKFQQFENAHIYKCDENRFKICIFFVVVGIFSLDFMVNQLC